MRTDGGWSVVVVGLVIMVVVGVAGLATGQQVPHQDVVCLLDCDGDPEDADVRCGGQVEEGDGWCEESDFDDETVEYAWIYHCDATCDADGDGDNDATTGEVELLAFETSAKDDMDIWYSQTYKDGVKLDVDEGDNSDTDCGYWWSSGDDELDYFTGQITDGTADGDCGQDEEAGYWNTGLDWDSD